MKFDGSNAQQVAKDLSYSTVPAFSPDGNKIAFSKSWGGCSEIFATNVNGTDLKQPTFNNSTNDGLKYSPNSKYIVFSNNVNGSGNPQNRDHFIMGDLLEKIASIDLWHEL